MPMSFNAKKQEHAPTCSCKLIKNLPLSNLVNKY